MVIGIVILMVILLLIMMGVTYKNRFVVLNTRVKNAWSQIDVQLQNRLDLIPNLVETVKGYANHEKTTFEGIALAKTKYVNATTVDEKIKASGEMSNFLGRLMAISEAYPELKANTNFINLQEQLTEIENKIRFARQFYNDTVTKYNQAIEMVPGCFFASLFKYKEAELFKAQESAIKAPEVRF